MESGQEQRGDSMNLTEAKAAVELLFDGHCTVYELDCRETGELAKLSYGESWRQVRSAKCHLQILQAEAASGADGARPQARGRLFLPAELGPELKPGSRVEVCQNGQRYRLGDAGLAVCWPTHCQVELILLE